MSKTDKNEYNDEIIEKRKNNMKIHALGVNRQP